MEPSIYFKSSKGFGNKVFDLIASCYIRQKYSENNIYFAIDKSIYDMEEDPFFGQVFPHSSSFLIYLFMNKYNRLKIELPIIEIVIDNLDDLPDTITENVRFIGLHKFIYLMYSEINDKSVFKINPKMISKKLENIENTEYGCIHIRYGDKLCYANEKFPSDKYTHYQYPVYTPDYYILQIRNLLDADIDVVIMTDTFDLVTQYIMPEFINNPKVTLVNSQYIESFYLLTKASYLILSHSTFSFSAAYLNDRAICYLVKKYPQHKNDYLDEDDAINPKWVQIKVKGFVLNYNQELVEQMINDTTMCKKYINI